MDYLPPLLHLQGAGPQAMPWIHATQQMIASEVAQARPGSIAIIERLAEVLFIQSLRTHCETACPNHGPSWLRALHDAQIGAVLQKIHADPGHAWTIEKLASQAGMSRSSFAAKFKTLVGATPLEHLTEWRMARAASLLRDPKPMKLEAIAAAVGYDSESSFRKAFHKVMGASPAEYKSSGARVL